MVRGRPKVSFDHLHAYGGALKIMNPGTLYALKLDDEKDFRYVFMALSPCIKGFLNCMRRVLVVDETHLHGKFKGVMLSANLINGNRQIYPVAFEVVDDETMMHGRGFF